MVNAFEDVRIEKRLMAKYPGTYDSLQHIANLIYSGIKDEDIAKLLSSVIDAVTTISNLYLKEYYQRRNRVIANYYFNKENAYDFFADTE